MKRFALTLTALFALGTVSVSPVAAQVAAVPQTMNFQGRLAKPDGTPVPNGTYSIRFSLWNVVSGGTPAANEKWSQTLAAVQVTNGVFAVPLNVSTGAADKFNGTLWLEIKIGADAALTPRTPLVTVPYAFKADLARTVPDGSITNAKIVAGTLTADKFAANAFNPLAWLLGGNSGTNPAANFLGTTDNQPLVFRTANTERMRFLSNGNLGIGETDPTSLVTINRNLAGGISLGPTPGIVIGNPEGSATLLMGQDSGKGVYYGWLQDSYAYLFTINGQPLVLQQYPGNVGIGTNAPNAKAHIAGGPAWTSNSWAKSLAINNAAALELGYGNSNRFGLGASGGNLYLFTSPSEAAADAANYRMVVNGSNGYMAVGTGIGATAPFPLTVQTSNPNYGFMHTAGAVSVGTYANASGGWFGTYSNHPLYFYTNNGGAAMTINNSQIILGKNTDVQGRLYANTGGDAILGFSTNGYGVWGSSSTSDAIHGISDTGTGVFGYSRTGWAVFANGSAGGYSGWFNLSDARYKKNVTTFENALDAILNLHGVTFDWNRDAWKDKNFADGRQIGFLAQEVEKVLPELVSTDKNGYKSVAYANVVPVLVEAVKTLKTHHDGDLKTLRAENAALRAELDALKAAKIAGLEARLERLEAALKAQR